MRDEIRGRKEKNVGEREDTIFSHSLSESFISSQVKVKVKECGRKGGNHLLSFNF